MSAILAQSRQLASQHLSFQQQVRFATKKAGGSSNNGRDSAGRRLGIKVWANQEIKPGAIILRQRGMKYYAGENVGVGKDHTIYSKIHGVVRMGKLGDLGYHDNPNRVVHKSKLKKTVAYVVPLEDAGSISAGM
mmetsp:Transcript_13516/g.27907  ORF Transcript_13516/g.27907 Transcript_13516/m.27907 type:complete len:134 (-) Transcript_13516:418-819(-)